MILKVHCLTLRINDGHIQVVVLDAIVGWVDESNWCIPTWLGE